MALSLDGTTGISASGNITGGNVIASGALIVSSFQPTSVCIGTYFRTSKFLKEKKAK
jgi:hypothetical protein